MVYWHSIHWDTAQTIRQNALLTTSNEPTLDFVSHHVQAYMPCFLRKGNYKGGRTA